MIVIRTWYTIRKGRKGEPGKYCRIAWRGVFLFGIIPLYIYSLNNTYQKIPF